MDLGKMLLILFIYYCDNISQRTKKEESIQRQNIAFKAIRSNSFNCYIVKLEDGNKKEQR